MRWACLSALICAVCGGRCVRAASVRWMLRYGRGMVLKGWLCTGVQRIREAGAMTVDRRLYPPRTVWQAMRLERLQQVGYVCETCGVPDAMQLFNANRPHPFYEQGTPYRQYLQLAH